MHCTLQTRRNMALAVDIMHECGPSYEMCPGSQKNTKISLY